MIEEPSKNMHFYPSFQKIVYNQLNNKWYNYVKFGRLQEEEVSLKQNKKQFQETNNFIKPI